MSTFWKTLLLSAAAAGVVAAGYAWLRHDAGAPVRAGAALSSLLNMDPENFSEEEVEALMNELASQL